MKISEARLGDRKTSASQKAIAKNVAREATKLLMHGLSHDLPEDIHPSVTTALTMLLQEITLMMANIDRQATAEMLVLAGRQMPNPQADAAAFLAAMTDLQFKMARAEITMMAKLDVAGQS